MNRIFAIPDIHGRNDLLHRALLDLRDNHALSFKDGDKIVFLGDMVDRGPDSFSVLQTIRELKEDHPQNVTALLGNHEQLMLDATGIDPKPDNVWLWEMNGGKATRQSFLEAGFPGVPEEWRQWVKALPLYHEEPGFFFSHAPVPRESHRAIWRKGQPYNQEDYTWTYARDEFGVAADRLKQGIVGVCGHMHKLADGIREPRFYPHYIFADAGCGCSAKAPLAVVEVHSRQVIYAWPEEAKERHLEGVAT